MKRSSLLALPVLSVLSALAAAPAASAELLFSTGWSNYTYVESKVCGTPAFEKEAADDFDLIASIERVYVTGYNSCLAICFPPPLSGVRVRFYAWTPAGPGALQSDQFVAAGDPRLAYDPAEIEDIDVTLPQPFVATGKHYVSVQLEFADCFFWAYWIANKDAPIGGPAYARTSGGAWTQVTAFSMQSSDLSYSLWGTAGPSAPPQGCGQWTEEPAPHPAGMDDSWLHDMAYLGPNDIWAVGRQYGKYTVSDWNQYTLAMHYDGSSWSIVPTPNPNPAPELTYCSLNAVAALAPNDIWAAGTRVDVDGGAGYVGTHNLVLHWNGSSWQQANAPIPPSFGLQGVSGDGIFDILALAPDDIWFFGEWITMNAQGFTSRYALAMHYDGSSFTVHDVPVVGGNGATIYASDALGPNDIWAVGAAGDGDPGTPNFSYIYHWDGARWTHVSPGTMPGTFHSLGGVKMLAQNDVWISGSAWSPPNVVTQFMLHWNGSSMQLVNVPFAGGKILGEPPAMYVFGGGGVSLFDGATFTDAHLSEGLESLIGYAFNDVVQTGSCEMIAVGSKGIAGDARPLVARLAPVTWKDLGHAKAGSLGLPALAGSGPLAALSANQIDLSNAAPNSVAMLVLGTSTLNAPLFGGLMVPAPLHLAALPTSAGGTAAVPFTWPASVPAGLDFYLQFWVSDPGATHGWSASNGLMGLSK